MKNNEIALLRFMIFCEKCERFWLVTWENIRHYLKIGFIKIKYITSVILIDLTKRIPVVNEVVLCLIIFLRPKCLEQERQTPLYNDCSLWSHEERIYTVRITLCYIFSLLVRVIIKTRKFSKSYFNLLLDQLVLAYFDPMQSGLTYARKKSFMLLAGLLDKEAREKIRVYPGKDEDTGGWYTVQDVYIAFSLGKWL